jgi:hypothetical protein
MEEYDDSDLGELDGEDANVIGVKDISQFDKVFDQFLDSQHLRGSRLVTLQDPMSEMDALREGLGEVSISETVKGDEADGGDDDLELLEDSDVSGDRWDCETILSKCYRWCSFLLCQMKHMLMILMQNELIHAVVFIAYSQIDTAFIFISCHVICLIRYSFYFISCNFLCT